MTSNPNDPAGPNPAPRPRSTPHQENGENELWDLDDQSAPTTPLVPVPRAKPDLTTPPTPPVKLTEPRPRQVGHTRINPSGRRKPAFQADPHRHLAGELGELDHGWEDVVQSKPEPAPANAAQAVPAQTVPEPAPDAPTFRTTPLESSRETQPEIEPSVPPDAAAPVSPAASRAPLTALEKGVLALLAALLLIAAAAFVIISWQRLPRDQSRSEAADFPVKGAVVTVKQVSTFWRVPTAQDRVRRETKLIPVIALQIEGGPAGLRFFFRNAQNEVMGDSVTRGATSDTLEVAATAGFEAEGMHAAYRTGEGKPWKVEVFEAPSEDSDRQEFKKLFETPISPDLH